MNSTLLSTSPHPIELTPNLIDSKLLISQLSKSHTIIIISDQMIYDNITKYFIADFEHLGIKIIHHAIDAKEENKSLNTSLKIIDHISSFYISNTTPILAIGGGIIMDIAGFIASIYYRGLPLHLVPTTLLAMIDASIGGKNGVNVKNKKNLIGTIYKPIKTWIDPYLLSSLPLKIWNEGLAEGIKISCVCDKQLFYFLKQNHHQLYSHPQLLHHFIKRSCELKSKITQKDLLCKGTRHILNFGHSLAHAIESVSHHLIPHGHAVGIGMLLEVKIAEILNLTKNPSLFHEIREILELYTLPTSLANLIKKLPIDIQRHFNMMNIINALSYDKKNTVLNEISIVILEDIGSVSPQITHHINISSLEKILAQTLEIEQLTCIKNTSS